MAVAREFCLFGRDSSALSRAEDEEKRVLWVGCPVAGSLMLAAPPATVVRPAGGERDAELDGGRDSGGSG